MSDTSQGTGWWQASDGKWYPPAPGASQVTQFCTNCGKSIDPAAVVCVSCGVPRKVSKNHCHNCAATLQANQVICTQCGASVVGSGGGGADGAGGSVENKKVIAGILAILFGAFGVHKFVLGYTSEGLIMLGITIVGSLIVIGPIAMVIIGIIEGIMYLTKSDVEFYETYQIGHKGWF